MVHENYKEMLAAYALTTLDREDVHSVEEHLASCRECRHELDDWHATVAVLALAAAPAEPSPLVRTRILESLRAEGSAPDAARERSEKHRDLIPTVMPFPQRRSLAVARKFGAITAALAFIALLISVMVLWKQNRSAHSDIAKLSAERASVQQDLDRQRKVIELLSAPGAKIAVLSGTAQAPNAHATLTYNQQTGQAVLLIKDLTPAPKGKAYQLWFIVGNQPMPGKVFTTDAAGKSILSDQVPSEALRAAVFAITLEPDTGVKSPTGPIYLRSSS